MTVAMAGLQRVGLLGRMPPLLLVHRTLRRLGSRGRKSSTMHRVAAVAGHFAYGGGAGLVFEVARSAARVRRSRPASRAALLASGAAYGGLLWASSYLGWGPRLGLMPHPRRDRPARPTSMVLAHVIYGVTLSAATGSRAAAGDDRSA